METEKTQNCQNNPEGREQSRRHNPPRLQTILQSYSNQNSMALANQKNEQKQLDTLMLWSIFHGSQHNRKIRSYHLVVNLQTPCHGPPGPPYLACSISPGYSQPASASSPTVHWPRWASSCPFGTFLFPPQECFFPHMFLRLLPCHC